MPHAQFLHKTVSWKWTCTISSILHNFCLKQARSCTISANCSLCPGLSNVFTNLKLTKIALAQLLHYRGDMSNWEITAPSQLAFILYLGVILLAAGPSNSLTDSRCPKGVASCCPNLGKRLSNGTFWSTHGHLGRNQKLLSFHFYKALHSYHPVALCSLILWSIKQVNNRRVYQIRLVLFVGRA